MKENFILQLIASFILWWAFIALLTLLAEKANRKLSWIILMLPSTAILGFFFLWYNYGPEKTSEVALLAFIPLALSVLFIPIYFWIGTFLDSKIKNKVIKIFLTEFGAILFWLVLSVWVAFFKIQSFLIGFLWFIVIAFFTHFLLHIKQPIEIKPLQYSFGQKLGRAIFVWLLISTIVFLSKVFGPFYGWIFAVFPAAGSATLIIYNWYYKPQEFLFMVQNVAKWSFSVFSYVIGVMILFPLIWIVWWSLFSLIWSILVSFLINRLSK